MKKSQKQATDQRMKTELEQAYTTIERQRASIEFYRNKAKRLELKLNEKARRAPKN